MPDAGGAVGTVGSAAATTNVDEDDERYWRMIDDEYEPRHFAFLRDLGKDSDSCRNGPIFARRGME